jgi:importin subunit alpha-1
MEDFNEACKWLPMIVQGCCSGNPDEQLECVTMLRDLIRAADYSDFHTPIQAIIDTGIVPKLVEFLSCKHLSDDMLDKCADALGAIASGSSSQTQCVIDAGAVPLLVELLRHKTAELSLRLEILLEILPTIGML